MRKIDDSVYVADGAKLIGNVIIGKNVSIWYNAVIRADSTTVTIGDNSNVQDNCCIHVNENYPCVLGRNVSVGHGAIIHSATIEDNVLVGMGSILMDNCHIGANTVIGAGSLISAGKVIPPNSLVFGSPAKVKRQLTPEEVKLMILDNADFYRAFSKMNEEQRFDENILDILEEFKGSWKEALEDK
ncbi:MAG: gamma carbonic anhydrase family protein [Anaerovoracaceae bacterium]|jgi:carbonic anhydrase/acetyltransferase-like protein (isoleucine patch superfamily)|nr:gamma carbonic anhydrase family protein [Bacillota bacterium]MDY2670240.1 gamma carbonic anhydrase family protein [Anaerovoracaceae bacterium]